MLWLFIFSSMFEVTDVGCELERWMKQWTIRDTDQFVTLEQVCNGANNTIIKLQYGVLIVSWSNSELLGSAFFLSSSSERFSQLTRSVIWYSLKTSLLKRFTKVTASLSVTSFRLNCTFFLSWSTQKSTLLPSNVKKTVCAGVIINMPGIFAPGSSSPETGNCELYFNFMRSNNACALPCSATSKAASVCSSPIRV